MNHSRLQYRMPYKGDDTDDSYVTENSDSDCKETEDEKEPQAES